MTNTHLRSLTGRNWFVADFKKALMGATLRYVNRKAPLCVLWGGDMDPTGGSSPRLLKDCPRGPLEGVRGPHEVRAGC